MAQNYIQEGEALDYLIPASTTIASGELIMIGNLRGVALSGGTTGDTIAVATCGVWEIEKLTTSGESYAAGARVYYDLTAKKATIVSTGTNVFIGGAVEITSQASTTVKVLLMQSGVRIPIVPQPAPTLTSPTPNETAIRSALITAGVFV